MTSAPVATMHEKVHYDAGKQQDGYQAITREDMNAVFKTEQYCSNSKKNDQPDPCA